MADEPEHVKLARSVIALWDASQAEARAVQMRQWLEKWRAEHIGFRHAVEVDAFEPHSDAHYIVKFTARLVVADKQEGEMVWDNGVTTTGVWIGNPILGE